MRNILIYCNAFYPENSGYANAYLGFITSLLNNNKDLSITVLTSTTLGNQNEIEIPNLKVKRLVSKNKLPKISFIINEIKACLELRYYLRNGYFDLCVIETIEQAVLLALLPSKLFDKIIVRIHATSETEYTWFSKRIDFRLRKYLLVNFVRKKLRWISATNNFHLDFLKEHLYKSNVIEIADRVFFTLPNTVPMRSGSVNDKLESRRSILMLGRMNSLGLNQKGFLDFVYSLKLLPNHYVNLLDIYVVGDGEHFERLRAMTSNIGSVKFIRNLDRSNMALLLDSVDAIVLPSRYEGLSMFALEGLAAGKVCIFSNTGGLKDLVQGNGYLFHPQSIEELAFSIMNFCDLSDEELKRMQTRSVELYNREFSNVRVSEKFNKLYILLTT